MASPAGSPPADPRQVPGLIMFPVHAKCVTFDAGYKAEQVRAAEELTLGRVYTIRSMHVGQSDSQLEFYEVPGQWSTVFFDSVAWEIGEAENDGHVANCSRSERCPGSKECK